ncbi:MAG: hypothetical protein VX800_00970 [Chloroflexota bacterium]|nr:hypothetical protein [Chloroflexota bacterium]
MYVSDLSVGSFMMTLVEMSTSNQQPQNNGSNSVDEWKVQDLIVLTDSLFGMTWQLRDASLFL